MKLLLVLAILSAILLFDVHGWAPKGKNVKELSWLERSLIRKSHPKINLDQILGLEEEHQSGSTIVNSNTIRDNYIGWVELYNTELPLLLLQLVKMGDNIVLPSFNWEYYWWFCYLGICSGFTDIFNIRNPRMKTVTTTNLHASMNGTQLRVEFKIPDMEIQCPECIYDYTEFVQDTPDNPDKIFWTGYSLYVKNYSLIMTCNVGWNVNRIELTDLDLIWEMDQLWDRQWNATHTFPNGTQEELGPEDDLMHERLLESWSTGVEEDVEQKITEWLNCYLSNGRNENENCTKYFDEPLHSLSAAEVIHGFGLAALNNQRASEQGSSGLSSLSADDPIETMNRIVFDFITHVLQTGKYAEAWQKAGTGSPSDSLPLQRAFTFVYDKQVCSEKSTKNINVTCETIQEQVSIGAPLSNNEYSTELFGAMDNQAHVTFGLNTFTYTFQVPNMTLSSTDFQRFLTNLNTGDQEVYSGLNLNVFNSSVEVTANYEFVDSHFIVFNLRTVLLLDRITMDISVASVFQNGEWIELPPIHKDAAPMVMQFWQDKDQDGVGFQDRYQVFLEENINDFLAGRIQI